MFKHLSPVALISGLHPHPEGRIGAQREDVRQEVAQGVHDSDRTIPIFNAYMHMQAKDQVGPRYQLQILDHLVIAGIRIDLLVAPVRKRVRRPGDQHQPILLSQPDQVTPQIVEILARHLNVAADPRSHLDHRLVQLRLDPLFQPNGSLRQHVRGDVRSQVARLRIDRLVLLFNPQRE